MLEPPPQALLCAEFREAVRAADAGARAASDHLLSLEQSDSPR
jgi:hypothetical protein